MPHQALVVIFLHLYATAVLNSTIISKQDNNIADSRKTDKPPFKANHELFVNATVAQSSIENNGRAKFAIDGDISTTFETQLEEGKVSWWTVRLAWPCLIQRIRITSKFKNIVGRCPLFKDLEVIGGDYLSNSNRLLKMESDHVSIEEPCTITVLLGGGKLLKYVSVLKHSGKLNIKEIEFEGRKWGSNNPRQRYYEDTTGFNFIVSPTLRLTTSWHTAPWDVKPIAYRLTYFVDYSNCPTERVAIRCKECDNHVFRWSLEAQQALTNNNRTDPKCSPNLQKQDLEFSGQLVYKISRNWNCNFSSDRVDVCLEIITIFGSEAKICRHLSNWCFRAILLKSLVTQSSRSFLDNGLARFAIDGSLQTYSSTSQATVTPAWWIIRFHLPLKLEYIHLYLKQETASSSNCQFTSSYNLRIDRGMTNNLMVHNGPLRQRLQDCSYEVWTYGVITRFIKITRRDKCLEIREIHFRGMFLTNYPKDKFITLSNANFAFGVNRQLEVSWLALPTDEQVLAYSVSYRAKTSNCLVEQVFFYCSHCQWNENAKKALNSEQQGRMCNTNKFERRDAFQRSQTSQVTYTLQRPMNWTCNTNSGKILVCLEAYTMFGARKLDGYCRELPDYCNSPFLAFSKVSQSGEEESGSPRNAIDNDLSTFALTKLDRHNNSYWVIRFSSQIHLTHIRFISAEKPGYDCRKYYNLLVFYGVKDTRWKDYVTRGVKPLSPCVFSIEGNTTLQYLKVFLYGAGMAIGELYFFATSIPSNETNADTNSLKDLNFTVNRSFGVTWQLLHWRLQVLKYTISYVSIKYGCTVEYADINCRDCELWGLVKRKERYRKPMCSSEHRVTKEAFTKGQSRLMTYRMERSMFWKCQPDYALRICISIFTVFGFAREKCLTTTDYCAYVIDLKLARAGLSYGSDANHAIDGDTSTAAYLTGPRQMWWAVHLGDAVELLAVQIYSSVKNESDSDLRCFTLGIFTGRMSMEFESILEQDDYNFTGTSECKFSLIISVPRLVQYIMIQRTSDEIDFMLREIKVFGNITQHTVAYTPNLKVINDSWKLAEVTWHSPRDTYPILAYHVYYKAHKADSCIIGHTIYTCFDCKMSSQYSKILGRKNAASIKRDNCKLYEGGNYGIKMYNYQGNKRSFIFSVRDRLDDWTCKLDRNLTVYLEVITVFGLQVWKTGIRDWCHFEIVTNTPSTDVILCAKSSRYMDPEGAILGRRLAIDNDLSTYTAMLIRRGFKAWWIIRFNYVYDIDRVSVYPPGFRCNRTIIDSIKVFVGPDAYRLFAMATLERHYSPEITPGCRSVSGSAVGVRYLKVQQEFPHGPEIHLFMFVSEIRFFGTKSIHQIDERTVNQLHDSKFKLDKSPDGYFHIKFSKLSWTHEILSYWVVGVVKRQEYSREQGRYNTVLRCLHLIRRYQCWHCALNNLYYNSRQNYPLIMDTYNYPQYLDHCQGSDVNQLDDTGHFFDVSTKDFDIEIPKNPDICNKHTGRVRTIYTITVTLHVVTMFGIYPRTLTHSAFGFCIRN